ncbi:MAG TPA: RidA family protein [Methylococcaceae bacterium]|jgi:reactive intermediate/imine deaminase|nr:RidA family protein [Methylococcaceae bacterium]HIA44620.1 RidA family protein [Methylococcaceae bacterium]HIB62172.1 RidA family protein [Methylococcaceae bacterium]HIN68036.1 RidA family protein [Methylococcales bacterium]HIO45094.1 RidA family protein [Methylococcales bacterium]
MKREVITTNQAPLAIGTYSQAIKANGMVFISGQIPLDPQTMSLIGGEIEKQIIQVFSNLRAITHAAGGDLSAIVKLTVFLTNLDDFETVNKVMAVFFATPFPARAVVGVAALPKDVSIEVDAIMVLADY